MYASSGLNEVNFLDFQQKGDFYFEWYRYLSQFQQTTIVSVRHSTPSVCRNFHVKSYTHPIVMGQNKTIWLVP